MSSIGGIPGATYSPYVGSANTMPSRSTLRDAAIGSSNVLVGQRLPGVGAGASTNPGLDTSCCIANENLI